MKILEYMIEEGLYEYSADTWGNAVQVENYESVGTAEGQINYKDEIFVISQHHGGGFGMGAYPDSVQVLRIKPAKKIKVTIIESEAGWGQRVDEIKEFNTVGEAEAFVADFNKDNIAGTTPAWYMYAFISDPK